MVSVMAHPWAADVVTSAQKVVTYVRAAPEVNGHLQQAAKALGINRGLQTSNQTRMTSVEMCVSSVVAMESAFRSLLQSNPGLVKSKQVVKLLQSREFWRKADVVQRLLQPFSQVIMAIQRDSAALADVTRYWIYLALTLRDMVDDLPPGEVIFKLIAI